MPASRAAAGRAVAVRRVGLVADEGMPAELAGRLVGELPAVLADRVDAGVCWRVEAVGESLVLGQDGMIPVREIAERYRRRKEWNVVLLLTDLPRRLDTEPVVADYSSTDCVGLVSLPALGGGFRLRARLRGLLVFLVGQLVADDPQIAALAGEASGSRLTTRLVRPLRPTRRVEAGGGGVDEHLALTGWAGRFRLLRGMVHDNRPWRLVPHLASATAAAAGTAAFGIFYSSIWKMADALPPWRLAVITLVAITAMVVWLIVYNHLWDHPGGHARPGQAVLYNAATVLTLFLGVACMYAMLYVLALLAAAAVIDAGYLRAQLGHPVSVADYATLVWLACSMGIVAGALGSSLDSEAAVRQATYSRREQERQARARAEQSGAAG